MKIHKKKLRNITKSIQLKTNLFLSEKQT